MECKACGHAVVAWCPEESIGKDDLVCYSCGLHANSEAASRIAELEAENEELLRDNKELKRGVNPLVYCELCGSCGEDGCCPPERCLLRKAEADLDRLRGWVKMAYFEGHADAQYDSISAADDWKGSEARRALEGEGNE